jgi:hypothetical protein
MCNKFTLFTMSFHLTTECVCLRWKHINHLNSTILLWGTGTGTLSCRKDMNEFLKKAQKDRLKGVGNVVLHACVKRNNALLEQTFLGAVCIYAKQTL